jgi:hypothetical protein
MQGALGPMELKPLGSASPTPPNCLGDWRAIVSKSLGRAGISQKVAAADLGVTEAALSKQLAGVEHLSFWRMHSLPPEFWHELVLLIIDFHGLTIGAASQRDIEDAAIGRCVRDAVSRCR